MDGMAPPRALIDPKLIYLESALRDYQRGRKVLARFPYAELVEVARHWEIVQLADSSTSTAESGCRRFPAPAGGERARGTAPPSIQRARLPPLAY
jgi:hypothetical protein